jgi:hypothetical protein
MALIIELLAGVRQTGPRSWVAKCPAHEDRSPSLSIREHQDGRWLMHCFAGCDVHDICAAIGIELADLFPEPLYHRAKPSQIRVTAADALACLSREAGIVAIAAADLAEGRAVDTDRVLRSAGLIAEALEVVRG